VPTICEAPPERQLADNPSGLLEYVGQQHQQLGQTQQALEEKAHQLADVQQELAQTQEELALKAQQLSEAQAIIAELKRELFGAKADKLNEEQEEQLRQLLGDLPKRRRRRICHLHAFAIDVQPASKKH
jgi:septal ring factor EnvC (AmiA/AmiB activator)